MSLSRRRLAGFYKVKDGQAWLTNGKYSVFTLLHRHVVLVRRHSAPVVNTADTQQVSSSLSLFYEKFSVSHLVLRFLSNNPRSGRADWRLNQSVSFLAQCMVGLSPTLCDLVANRWRRRVTEYRHSWALQDSLSLSPCGYQKLIGRERARILYTVCVEEWKWMSAFSLSLMCVVLQWDVVLPFCGSLVSATLSFSWYAPVARGAEFKGSLKPAFLAIWMLNVQPQSSGSRACLCELTVKDVDHKTKTISWKTL